MNLRPFQQIFGTLFVLFLVKSDYFRRQKQLNKKFPSHSEIKNTARTGRIYCWGKTVMDEVLGTFFCDYDVLPAYVQQCIQTEAISEVRPYVHKLYI